MSLEGKRALVTGASRGIGAGIAKRLAAAGTDVAITYEKSADRAAEVVRDIEARGRKAVAIQADSADVNAIQRSVETAVAELGGLDILINNAGIMRVGDLKDMSIEDIEQLIKVNMRAPIVASKAVLPHLGQGGRIVTIGSYLAERVPWSVVSIYAATKSAMVAFTKGLARELGPQGVTVNLVHPGPIETDMNPETGFYGRRQLEMTSNGRFGKSEEIGDAIVFLVSEKARYITGTALTVDGGILC